MNRIYDVTLPLSTALPSYPGDPPFEIQVLQSMSAGQSCNLSRLAMGTHAGTHVDAPLHFIPGGASVDRLPLEILVGKARVVELDVAGRIERRDLQAADLRDDIRVLLKTRMSGQLRGPQFEEDFVHLGEDAARYLVQAGIKLVGIDSLSVEAFGSTQYPAHKALLGAGVVIVEGLDLSEVGAGEYEMTCLPLRLVGGDGAPARVMLRTRA
jgi:arylformamidase